MWIHTSGGEQTGQLAQLVLVWTGHHSLPGRDLGINLLQDGGGQAKRRGEGEEGIGGNGGEMWGRGTAESWYYSAWSLHVPPV